MRCPSRRHLSDIYNRFCSGWEHTVLLQRVVSRTKPVLVHAKNSGVSEEKKQGKASCSPKFLMTCILIWSSLFKRQWHPTPIFLPGKSHGWRSLVGCSPWGCEESDTTERLHFHFSLSCIREGNGNPLQCSCLENPRDGGAWWAAIYGVAQSRTQLKWLSRYRIKS